MTTPTDPAALAPELQRLLNERRTDEALARARDARDAHPGDPRVLAVVAPFLFAVKRFAEARAAFEALADLGVEAPRALMHAAACAQHEGDLAGMEAAADRLLELAPEHPAGIGLKADAMYYGGRTREAFELLAPRARAQGAHAALVVNFARVCRVVGKQWEGISALERTLEAPGVHPVIAADGWFHLANLRDSVGRFDEAWSAITRANGMKQAAFDADGFERRARAMTEAWTPGAVAALPACEPLPGAVLIVGMPRSGTTLAEQILASHPDVAAGGELTDLTDAVIRLNGAMAAEPPLLESPSALSPEAVAREHAAYAARHAAIAAGAARTTDKMPTNALHLGLARAIAPGCRVVWCRRDPLDTCVSCYFQHFGGANAFAYDLHHLARFHLALDRVMAHWQATLGLPILELPYEQLVADQETWTRRLLDFAGLPWNDTCLRFHESGRVALTASNDQVRRPMAAGSVGRWKRYEQHLAPLREVLGE